MSAMLLPAQAKEIADMSEKEIINVCIKRADEDPLLNKPGMKADMREALVEACVDGMHRTQEWQLSERIGIDQPGKGQNARTPKKNEEGI